VTPRIFTSEESAIVRRLRAKGAAWTECAEAVASTVNVVRRAFDEDFRERAALQKVRARDAKRQLRAPRPDFRPSIPATTIRVNGVEISVAHVRFPDEVRG
jgi:hypothetical protein